MTYQEYLKSDHWKKLRKEALNKAGDKCYLSGSTFRLECHHLTYKYPLQACTADDIIVLSDEWHERVHRWVENDKVYEDSDSNAAKRAKLKLRYKAFMVKRFHDPTPYIQKKQSQKRHSILLKIKRLELKIYQLNELLLNLNE